MTIEVEVSARRDGELRCVFCREELTGAVETCPGCGVTCHPACRAEMSRCATIGCSGVRVEEGASPRPRASSRRARLADEVEPARPRSRSREAPPRAPDPEDDGLHRARTPGQLAGWSVAGASFGVGAGLLVAFMASRHGLEAAVTLRACSIGLVLGAVEGAAIGSLGVRRDPLIPGQGDKHPTSVVVGLALGLLGTAGGIVGHQLHASPLAGALAVLLLALPLLLRWVGFG